MDIQQIAFNISKMLEYRLNSNNLNFEITFKMYEIPEKNVKLTYKIKNLSNNQYSVEYFEDKLYKSVLINIDFNEIKNHLDDENLIILYPSNLSTRINKIINGGEYKCEFFVIDIFYTNYRNNIYFVPCCKSNEKTITEKIQYISSQDFNVLYLGLRPGDVIFINNIIDSSLSLPQLRIIRKI